MMLNIIERKNKLVENEIPSALVTWDETQQSEFLH